MNKLRNPVAALVIMSVLISLSLLIYDGFQDGYGYTEQDLQNETTVMGALENLDLLSSANDVSNAINVLKNPKNPLDLLGGLTAAGIGVLQVIKNIVFFPTNIIQVLGTFYGLPGFLSITLGLLFNVYIFFIILSAYLGKDL